MKYKIKTNHPIGLIAHFESILPKNAECEFAHFYYEKQSDCDRREIIRCKISEAEQFFWDDSFISINKNYDIALQSRIYVNDKTYHIPMCDFFSDIDNNKMHTLLKLLLPLKISDLAVFYSGNSYHGYGFELLENSDYFEFLGRLLLANLPHQHKIIDDRWVGHRLIAGYMSLRLTYNQPKYIKRKLFFFKTYNFNELDDNILSSI